MNMEESVESVSLVAKVLTKDEQNILEQQNNRPLSDFTKSKFEKNAQKHWDLFYKRNCERFFKNRYWTMKEFEELSDGGNRKILLEVGCGVGNLLYPLIEEGLFLKIYACDFSPRAIQLVKENPRYNPEIITAFQADLTVADSLSCNVKEAVDIVTMVFVLSAIAPSLFSNAIRNLAAVLKPGGIVFFRDYGLYDMAQLRFKPGHKIADQYYVRQDGTRSYFFTIEELRKLFANEGFTELSNTYVNRRTVNRKECIDVPRIFIQAKFQKKL
ncbi:hypothetical protein O3M35_002995 [Rhynocoris fuscipes]|uniref:tRNA N(3)-methylcytidine methyltransferase n=1 Tax=Rhynocoris fuscipes TaxID=488301 RepID=A0AAW1CLH2_9HEMI